MSRAFSRRVDRRSLLKGAVAAGALSILGGTVSRRTAAQDSGGTQAATWEEPARAAMLAPAATSNQSFTSFESDFTFYAIAPHWAADGDPAGQVEIQLSSDGSTWSDPVTVGVDNIDAGQPDREGRHFGPLIFTADGANAVRYRTLDGNGDPAHLDGMAFTYIDASSGPSLNAIGPAADDPTDITIPPIISRANWGADESYRFDSNGDEIWPPEYQTVEHVIIHHSDTPNFDDPLVTIRSIYYYHAITRGWGDIGYNYVVDYIGHVYEGRYGGENVVGGHAFQYNHGSSGICTMGDFMTVDETPEAQTGLIWITAWAGRYLDPLGHSDFHEQANLATICGHRDVLPTDCPGVQVWYDLPYIRNRVNDILNNSGNPAPTPALTPGDKVQVTVDGGNLRSGPGISFNVLASLDAGTSMTVIDGPATNDDYAWYEVTGDPGSGWVATVIIEKVASGSPRFAAGDHVVVNSGGLNLRNAPGLDGKVIAVLSAGTTATVVSGPEVSGGYSWYKIDTSAGTGWVVDAYLDGASSQPPSGQFQVGDTVVVDTDLLNLRSSPSPSANVIAQMPNGTQLTIADGPQSAGGYTWYKVTSSSYGIGWCAGDYLAPASAPPTGDFRAGDVAMVNTDALNLRSGAGTSGSVIAQMPYGANVTITDGPQTADGYTWYKVNSATYGTGWCAGDFLAHASGGTAIQPGGTVQVIDGNLNMRSGPGLANPVVAVLPDGTQLSVLDGPSSADGYDWYKVSNNSYGTGWCVSAYLQPV